MPSPPVLARLAVGAFDDMKKSAGAQLIVCQTALVLVIFRVTR